MANGRISRLSAFSDILKEDGKRRLSNTRESRVSITDVEARTIENKVFTDVLSMAAKETTDVNSEERHFLFKCSSEGEEKAINQLELGIKLETLDIICKFLGELIGTALLLIFACMGLIQWTQNTQPYFVGGLVFGLTIMFIIQVLGAISGAHINPAVTLAALIYGKISILMACLYVVAQFIGAIIGFGVLTQLTPTVIFRPEGSVGTGVCSPSPNPALNVGQVFFFEFLATAVLISMCCAAWDPRNANKQESMPIKFGLATAIPFIAVSPATGCCINPARAFAPAMYNNDWELHWVYWLSPLLAAAVTTTVYKVVFYREVPADKKET